MKILRKIVPVFVLGVGIGSLMECLLSSVYGRVLIRTLAFMAPHPSPVFVRIIRALFYEGFGLVSLLGEQFFPKKNNKSLFEATTIHSLLILTYLVFTGFYLYWPPNTSSVLISLGILALVYSVIWILIYLAEKRKIGEMNRVLERNHNRLVDE